MVLKRPEIKLTATVLLCFLLCFIFLFFGCAEEESKPDKPDKPDKTDKAITIATEADTGVKIVSVDSYTKLALIEYEDENCPDLTGWYFTYGTKDKLPLDNRTEIFKGLIYVDIQGTDMLTNLEKKDSFTAKLYNGEDKKLSQWKKDKDESALYSFEVKEMRVFEEQAENGPFGHFIWKVYFVWRPTSYVNLYEIKLNKNGNDEIPPESALTFVDGPSSDTPNYEGIKSWYYNTFYDGAMLYIGDYNRFVGFQGNYITIYDNGPREIKDAGLHCLLLFNMLYRYDPSPFDVYYDPPEEVEADIKVMRAFAEKMVEGWTISVRPIS